MEKALRQLTDPALVATSYIMGTGGAFGAWLVSGSILGGAAGCALFPVITIVALQAIEHLSSLKCFFQNALPLAPIFGALVTIAVLASYGFSFIGSIAPIACTAVSVISIATLIIDMAPHL